MLSFVPGTWCQAQGAAAIWRAGTGMGELEGRQSPGLAARWVSQLWWQRDTSCNCTSALPLRHRRMNSWLQPAAAPASLSRWAGSGRADAGWNHQAVGHHKVPGVSHSPAMSSHPAGPASCYLLGLTTSVRPSKAGRCLCPQDPIRPLQPPLLGLGCPEQLSPGTVFHRHQQTPHSRKSFPVTLSFPGKKAPVPAAFWGAPGRCRWLARAARALSWAGRGSICFTAPQGFLSRSLLFYSLWDLEKPVVPDNPWTRQHRHSSGSPGACPRPPQVPAGGCVGSCPASSARCELGEKNVAQTMGMSS
ncbi:uncharacterized protein LOC130143792 [Falco biarmicus]|uniref:uncharacterized protein LOC130143792 n=1 Tax=Falco biarmicus TaxID=345155 RepID=UPI0024BC7253|nr:uncharacterized protein LOC130143792 [Falco biarmicus]